MEKIHLNTEQENMVIENENLVHYILQKKMCILPTSNEYEDKFQIGIIGLIKAIRQFDKSKNVKFSHFGTRCITNEIFMDYRKNKKHRNNISLDCSLSVDEDGKSLSIVDTIIDASVVDFGKLMVTGELINQSFNIIANCLTTQGKIAMMYQMAGLSQYCIAMMLNIGQPYVSRLTKKSQDNVRKILENNKMYNEKFKISFKGEFFQIEFLLADTGKTYDELENFLMNEEKVFKLPFKITCVEGMVRIYFFAVKESFLYIAELFRRIEGTESICEKDFCAVFKEYEQIKSQNTIRNSGNISSQVRDFILKFDSFTTKDVRNNFPNISGNNISASIHQEYLKGTIKKGISRGEYTVVSKNIVVSDEINSCNLKEIPNM